MLTLSLNTIEQIIQMYKLCFFTMNWIYNLHLDLHTIYCCIVQYVSRLSDCHYKSSEHEYWDMIKYLLRTKTV